MSPTKVCQDCVEELPRDDFSVDRARVDGLQERCKLCQSARMMAAEFRMLASHADGRAKLVREIDRHLRTAEYARLALDGKLAKNPRKPR